jgi:hypothetical protein
MYVLNTLAPLFLIVALGTALRRGGFCGPAFYQGLNRLVYWVALPCMMFEKTAQAAVPGGAATRVFLALLVTTALAVLLAFVVARLAGVERRSVGAFVQGAYRGNLFYVGLPVVLFAVAEQGDAVSEALAVVAIAPMVPVYNITAVVVLLSTRPPHHAGQQSRLRPLVFNVLTNPLVLSCVAGISYRATGWPLPVVARRTLGTVGNMALPLALLGIGAALTLRALRSGLAHSAGASLVKVAAAPVLGYLVCAQLGLSGPLLRMVLLYLACPTAVASFVMAEQLGGDAELASNIVVVSTLLSFPAFIVVLLI